MFHYRKLEYPDWKWTPGPENTHWTQPTPGDDGSAELELHWLLYALVSIIKPKIAFESGCCHGYSSYWMARAVMDNQVGKFVTCDVNPEYTEETVARFDDALIWWTRVLQGRAAECHELREADFFFCDSNYGDRAEELSLLKPGCIALVHDTNAYARQWANGAPDLAPVVAGFKEHLFFPMTLRGFALLRKV